MGARTCKCDRQCIKTWASKNKLLLVTAVGIVVGIILGIAVRQAEPSDTAIEWIGIWGDLFLRMLKMVILPIIVSSLVVGVASLNGKSSGRMGVVALCFIIGTNTLGSITGVVLTVAVHPGSNFGDPIPSAELRTATEVDAFADLLKNLVPQNIIQACFQQLQTKVELVDLNTTSNATKMVKTYEYVNGMNIIGIITFSIALGISLAASGEKGKPLFQVFDSLHHVIFKLMMAITWYSPVGIASMIAAAILQVDDFTVVFQSLGVFAATVIGGVLIYEFIVIPLLILIVIRKNPFKMYLFFLQAIFMGIAPPSSMAAMPGLFDAMEEKMKIDKRVTKFFIPLAVTLIRGGSALFICSATIFIGQTYGINIGVGSLCIVGLLTSVLSCATAAVPSSSLIIMMMVSTAVGVPVSERLGLLLGMEWLLDRIRTSANIATQGYGSVVIYHFCKKELAEIPEINQVDCDNEENANTQKTALVSL